MHWKEGLNENLLKILRLKTILAKSGTESSSVTFIQMVTHVVSDQLHLEADNSRTSATSSGRCTGLEKIVGAVRYALLSLAVHVVLCCLRNTIRSGPASPSGTGPCAEYRTSPIFKCGN